MNQSTNVIARLSQVLALLLICWCSLLNAQIPRTLNYQGYLTSPSGAAINNASLALTFKLYTVASGGTALYSETQSVNVINGIFNALIGSGTPLTLAFDQPYFVGISAGTDPEMTPRQPLAASPYAIRSASSESLAATALIAPSNLPAVQLLPTVACLTNQIPQWNGSAWICATASSGSGSGTVTNVATGAGLTGGPISTTGTISISPGGVTTAMLAANSVTQAKLSPLSGGTAGKVLGTDGSNLQWQAVPVPGITFVTPSSVAAGRTATVDVIGEATNFDGSTTVGAGAGISVLSVIPVSRTALQVTLSASPVAAVGLRTISVATGAQVLTLPSGLRVVPALSSSVAVGALSQGSSALVLARPAAGRTFAAAVAGSVLNVGNAIFALSPSPGLAIISNRWLGPDTAELLVEVSPFADTTSSASLIVNYTGGAADSAFSFAPIEFNPVQPVTVGTPAFWALSIPREAGLFSIAVANAPTTLQFTVSPEPGGLLSPRVRLYPAGNPTAISDVNAATGTAMFATNGTYVFSVVDKNGGGGVTGYDFTFSLSP